MRCNLSSRFHKLNGEVSQNLHIAVITTQLGIFVTPSVSIFASNDRQFMWKLPHRLKRDLSVSFYSSNARTPRYLYRGISYKYARLKFSRESLWFRKDMCQFTDWNMATDFRGMGGRRRRCFRTRWRDASCKLAFKFGGVRISGVSFALCSETFGKFHLDEWHRVAWRVTKAIVACILTVGQYSRAWFM